MTPVDTSRPNSKCDLISQSQSSGVSKTNYCCFYKEVKQALFPSICEQPWSAPHESVNSREPWKELVILLKSWRCAACCPQLFISLWLLLLVSLLCNISSWSAVKKWPLSCFVEAFLMNNSGQCKSQWQTYCISFDYFISHLVFHQLNVFNVKLQQ